MIPGFNVRLEVSYAYNQTVNKRENKSGIVFIPIIVQRVMNKKFIS